MDTLDETNLIYDWARAGRRQAKWPKHVMLDDETLRDGLQSPSVVDPALETKVQILHLMEGFGIETADIGLPGAGARQYQAVLRLCREISEQRMRIRPNCAARTMMVDIQPIAEISQITGVPMDAAIFIGSSPIRQYAEEWELEFILRQTRDAVRFAVREGLGVMYVTEDTVRSSPEDLEPLLRAAIDEGASRVCLCDTCGAAVPDAVYNLVSWAKELITGMGVDVGIDWHGHRDRGLDLANSLAAIEAGATRVHGTALGIGERVGNTPMEQLLVNLQLLGLRDDDLTRLPEYIDLVAKATGMSIGVNQPVVGRDCFRTATGVHAAAIVKAKKRGHDWLADRVYSGVPAGMIGRTQTIEIGPMSGASNVSWYLREREMPSEPAIVQTVLNAAKQSDRILDESEISALVKIAEAAAAVAAKA
ncbi:MAG: LeuA family protein [Thermoanaerobaculia bacterium]